MNRRERTFAAVVVWIDDRVVKKAVRLLLRLGLAPRAFALLETTGSRSGLARQAPVGNGLIGKTFWLIAARGEAARYVRNLQHHPDVRIKIGRTWSAGVAEVLPDDDPDRRVEQILAHHGWLRRLDAKVLNVFIGLMQTTPLVVRITLSDSPPDASPTSAA